MLLSDFIILVIKNVYESIFILSFLGIISQDLCSIFKRDLFSENGDHEIAINDISELLTYFKLK